MKFKKITLLFLFILLLIIGVEGMIAFRGGHAYYGEMIFSRRNLGLILSAFGAAWIPFLAIVKKGSFKSILVRTGLGLGVFAILSGFLTNSLLGIFAIFPLLFNTFLLYALAVVFLFSVFGGGHWIARKLKLFQTIRWQETLLTFGLGLVSFLVLMQIFMGIHLFYSIVIWLFFIGLFVLAWFEKKHMSAHQEALNQVFPSLREAKDSSNYGRIWSVLLLSSFAYYFFNFSHSFIPYSTAWDANHEYMYIPKVIAENAGILRGNLGAAGSMPYLWHSFIAFFFSLWAPIAKVLNIAKDTVAVNLNALSGLFVLFFSLGAVKEVLGVFKKQREESESSSQTSFLIGWGLILMWLTSGMGAFLLFVDNKTDMGVLSLTILAILGGLVFFNHFQKKGVHIDSKQSLKYLLLSAFFFAFAIMAKPTAFIDVVVFSLLMVGFWLNTTSLVGLGIAVLGLMGIVQPLFTGAFISPALGKGILLVGVIILVIGAVRGLFSRNEHFSKRFKHLLIWGFTIVGALFIFKAPWVAVRGIVYGDFQVGKFLKTTLLGHAHISDSKIKSEDKSRLLLTQTQELSTLEYQNAVDSDVLDQETKNLSYGECVREKIDKEDLDASKQRAPGSALNEDVGRYVGYGARVFPKTGVGGFFLKLLFWKNNHCFGWDHDGLLLCKNQKLIENQNFTGIKALVPEMNQGGQAYTLVQNLIDVHQSGKDLRDPYKALTTYYQEHSIYTTNIGVYIPYRYIVPLNVVFNWSLQNHSSYYTDIGLIWLCVFAIILVGLIYAIATYDKQHKQLLFISFATVLGWAIWWAIGGGIVWYGLGLIMRSIFVVVSFFQEWEDKEEVKLKPRYLTLIGLFVFYLFVQSLLNFSRIASQITEGPFAQYKSNVGEKQRITDEFQLVVKKDYGFDANDIFNLQFGQYIPFIDAVADRKDEDGVLIAGTYMQYFLKNQKNLRMDGMLTWFWEEISDFDSCRSYQRLKNEHVKYLVIDTNIGTVGRAGEGNESLFYRFFARLTEDEKKILTHGAITMILKMAQEGYLDLLYTNNIGTKYAFELPDSDLISVFGLKTKEDLLLLRSKIAVAKFFYQDQSLLEGIYTVFQQRIANGKGLSDIANVLGKKVSEAKLLPVFQQLLQGKLSSASSLSQDEKLVLAQYFGIYKMFAGGQQDRAQESLMKIFQNSLFGSSQIIALELK